MGLFTDDLLPYLLIVEGEGPPPLNNLSSLKIDLKR
jgi:hypothetical protein